MRNFQRKYEAKVTRLDMSIENSNESIREKAIEGRFVGQNINADRQIVK